ncbi:hydrogenase maturation protease [Thermosulfurimonas marina]|uniref:hydrogenase maturation protease n=1 Tax=Thermosulfurimonas marina TaxID=2047767 RepID=UPI00144ADA73|nr:hydrogenase maturation protease [Thermosulfurimonas marina]
MGNLLLSDEGFGVHVVRELERRYRIPPEVEVVDGGCLGFSLPDYLRGRERVWVIDVVAAEALPGTIFTFRGKEVLSSFGALKPRTAHEATLVEALHFAEFAGVLPEDLTVFAAVPERLSPGLELSAPLQRALEEVLILLRSELAACGLGLEEKLCA